MRMWPSARPYTAAALAVVLTVPLKGLIEASLGAGPPLLIYLPAVTFGAWTGGLGPGLLAAALSSAVCAFLPLGPVGAFSLANTHDRLRLVVFLAEGFLLGATMEWLHVARRRSEASEREARRYQDELARSEARLRAILDNSPSAIFLKDLDGRYLLANRRVEVLCESAPGQLTGKADTDIFPPGVAQQLRANDRTVVRLGEAVELEEVLDADDGPHTYLVVKFPLRGADGDVYAVGGIATDITERKRVERDLAASERRFRTLSQHAPIGIFLADREGRNTYTNPRCQQIFGSGPDEARGDGWARFVHPEDRDDVVRRWRRHTPTGGALSIEHRTIGADGSTRWVHGCTVPLLSESGELLGYVGTVEDITERKAAEEALRRERDFAEGLIDTARAIVLVLDARGRVVRVNPYLEQVTGRRPDEVCGADWFAALVPPGDCCRARTATLRALAGEAGAPVIYPLTAADGRRRLVEWANRAVDGPGGEPCILAIGHDLTALEEAQDRALQAERLAAIGEMVAGLSHESRNALHRTQVCLEMLAFEVEDRPEATGLIARLQAALDDLHRVFEDVRTYAAPIVLDVGPCDLAEVWRDSWAQLGASRPGRDDALLEALDGCDTRCAADPFRLGQVFRNILDNALNAGPGPARVEIACGAADLDGRPAIRVAVRDDGPGLGPEARRRIFEPFFTTKIRGTGLGMAITRRIVEAHGGHIAVGDGAGPGAEIIVTLPRGPS